MLNSKTYYQTKAASQFYQRPAKTIIAGFISIILIGSVLLMLPQASAISKLSFIDALFMSTSATCVTGLSTIDIGQHLSLLGQMIILSLIQIGGIGIMSVSTFVILMLGKRPGVINNMIMQDSFTHSKDKSPSRILKQVLILTFCAETIGFIILLPQFLQEYSLKRSVYYSVFHSISAFCNAGFSPFQTSLIPYKENILMNMTFSILIIVGGLGYFVIFEIFNKTFHHKKKTPFRFSLHTKLVLMATGLLIFFGTLAILGMEWENSLKGLSVPHKVVASFFQSVTARTAGFNTIPVGKMANETLFLLMFLMFIGAGPGSCAGGIKVTTFVALVILGFSKVVGKQRSQIFKRSLSFTTTEKAVSMLMVSMTVIALGTMFILTSELGPVSHENSQGKFLELLFETTSAFGTVGLSTGITSQLTWTGKLILTILMFVGRTGPLTVVLAVFRPVENNYYYPQEEIMIG